jgi:hypothetical protein
MQGRRLKHQISLCSVFISMDGDAAIKLLNKALENPELLRATFRNVKKTIIQQFAQIWTQQITDSS